MKVMELRLYEVRGRGIPSLASNEGGASAEAATIKGGVEWTEGKDGGM